MLPLQLFKARNFTVGNLTTLTLYAGLGVATFFLVLFIQQVGGYTPVEGGPVAAADHDDHVHCSRGGSARSPTGSVRTCSWGSDRSSPALGYWC